MMLKIEPQNSSPMPTQQEQWSALHDGELSASDALALVRASLQDDSLMQQWRAMSAVGQILREQGSASEPQTHLPAAVVMPQQSASEPAQTQPNTQAAANDSRWKMLAGISALAAVGSLVWGLLGASGAGQSGSGVLASNSGSSAVLISTQGVSGNSNLNANINSTSQENAMIRNPRLDELLAAHKQFGGVSALQQPAGSLRSVSLASHRP